MTPPRISPVPAAINHLLAGEAWARHRLAAHAGKVAAIDLELATLRFRVAADGLLEAAPPDAVAELTIRIRLIDLPLMAQHRERAFSYARIEGDADFAHVISQLGQNLRWEAEQDLSRLVGATAAVRIVAGARSATRNVNAGGQRLAADVAEYFIEQNPLLVRPRAVRELADSVSTLRNDLERLAKRIERLEQGRLK